MTIYSVLSSSWHPDDVKMVAEQKPSIATTHSGKFDIDFYQLKPEDWEQFRKYISMALKLAKYEGRFVFHLSLNALSNKERAWNKIESRLLRLKHVDDVMWPVPACPEWQVRLEFEKFPTLNEFNVAKQAVERAAYGKLKVE